MLPKTGIKNMNTPMLLQNWVLCKKMGAAHYSTFFMEMRWLSWAREFIRSFCNFVLKCQHFVLHHLLHFLMLSDKYVVSSNTGLCGRHIHKAWWFSLSSRIKFQNIYGCHLSNIKKGLLLLSRNSIAAYNR